MQLLNARFVTQDAAESAVRKLASLRSEGIRLERRVSNADRVSPSLDAGQMADGLTSMSGSLAQSAPASEFALSVNVPSSVADQARKVILEAGGQISK